MLKTPLTALSLSLLLLLSACSLSATPVPTAAPTATPTPAATPTPMPTSALPASHGLEVRGVVYCAAQDVPLLADIYFAQSGEGPRPLILYVHGGGWSGGSRVGGSGFEGQFLFVQSGFTVVSIDYRLAPRYPMPAMIEDVKCAVRSFRAHAAEYGIDPDHIGVIGHSAGAHLAALAGTSDETAGFDVGGYAGVSSRVQAVVDLAGPADLTDPSTPYASFLADQVFGFQDPADPRLAAASPVTWITPDDPPFLIIHGDADGDVPLSQSQNFAQALTAGGVEARLMVVEGGDHNLIYPVGSPEREQMLAAILEFFETHLK